MSEWLDTLRAGHARARRLRKPVVAVYRESVADPPDPLALFAAAESHGVSRFFAAGPDDAFSLLGLGSAHEILSEHAQPIQDIRGRARALLQDGDPGALLLGGFAFRARPRNEQAEHWRAFGNARFLLPELLLTRRGDEVLITRMARVGPDESDDTLARRLETPWLEKRAGSTPASRPGTLKPLEEDPTDDFIAQMREVIAAIRSQEVEKVVLATSLRHALGARLPAPELLRVLRSTHPAAYLFAQGFGHDTFLGATPELLVRRRGLDVVASAVAGTAGCGETQEETAKLGLELRTSPKERAEHAFVVGAIREGLQDLCPTLEVPRSPSLMRSGAVQHLQTEIQGTLEEARHVLDLVGRLHPTPAVAGTPREAALLQIAKHESFDRGLYAGPIGWFNASGEGDFLVALRCGLLAPGSIHLFAGAGLVADSDPDREAAEVQLKLSAMRGALEMACRA